MNRAKPFGVVIVLLAALSASPSYHVASASGATSPWEQDTNADGSIRFYDSRGNLITTGRTADAPFASFAQSSRDGASGDNLASMSVFTPDEGASADSWTGQVLSGPSTYPNAAAPATVNGTVLPVVSGQTGDRSLASYIAAHPNRSSAPGYANIYQLRMSTSQGAGQTGPYAATYVSVNAGTWTQVYPDVDSTTTVMSVAPATWVPGTTSIALVTKLTPATVGGTVTFFDGQRLLGTLQPRAIQASLSDVQLAQGSHVLSAIFTPDGSSFQSSSASVVYDMSGSSVQPTTTTLDVNPSGSVVEGTTVTLTATVDPTSAPGSVTFYDGPHVLSSAVPLSQGAAAFATTGLKASEHHLSARYQPSSAAFAGSASGDVKLKVVKRKTPPPTDNQTIVVKVPGTQVKGITKSRGGVLGRTGAATLGVLLVGLIGLGIGAAVRSSARNRKQASPTHHLDRS